MRRETCGEIDLTSWPHGSRDRAKFSQDVRFELVMDRLASEMLTGGHMAAVLWLAMASYLNPMTVGSGG